jgi:hypothetical protein
VVPHLTVAHGNALEAEAAARELALAIRVHGPIRSRCEAVALLENASGRWKERHAFALPSLSARSRRP